METFRGGGNFATGLKVVGKICFLLVMVYVMHSIQKYDTKHYDRYFFKGALETVPSGKVDLGQREVNAEASEAEFKKTSGQPRSRFSNTLGEQLKNMDLNLLAGDNQDKNNE